MHHIVLNSAAFARVFSGGLRRSAGQFFHDTSPLFFLFYVIGKTPISVKLNQMKETERYIKGLRTAMPIIPLTLKNTKNVSGGTVRDKVGNRCTCGTAYRSYRN